MPIARMMPQGEFLIMEPEKDTLASGVDKLGLNEGPMAGMPELPPEWKLKTNPRVEWRPTNPQHPAFKFIHDVFKVEPATSEQLTKTLATLPASVTKLSIPVLYVDDARGLVLRDVATEERFFRTGTQPEQQQQLIAWVPHLWVMHRPTASILFEEGKFAQAMEAANQGASFLHRALYLKARAKLETEEALKAFKILFQHYSYNEELWRLEQLMQNLPFDLEEHPGMSKYRELLGAQTGHLRGPDGIIDQQAIARWYTEDSPPAGFDKEYVKNAMSGFAGAPTRLRWLIERCHQEGYKTLAEFGAVDGVSLFYLTAVQGIKIIGFEANPVCVERGRELATQCNATIDLRPMAEFVPAGPYDAVALFEFLEHNDPAGGIEHVRHCFNQLNPNGTLFITTPCGNWSLFDEHTRDVTLRKDHILAYTPQRMVRFLIEALKGQPASIEQCEQVENPVTQEANSWVFVRIRKTA